MFSIFKREMWPARQDKSNDRIFIQLCSGWYLLFNNNTKLKKRSYSIETEDFRVRPIATKEINKISNSDENDYFSTDGQKSSVCARHKRPILIKWLTFFSLLKNCNYSASYMANAKYHNCHTFEFSIIRYFLANHGRVLPALTYNGRDPLNVNAGRILPWFARKCRIVEKLEYSVWT